MGFITQWIDTWNPTSISNNLIAILWLLSIVACVCYFAYEWNVKYAFEHTDPARRRLFTLYYSVKFIVVAVLSPVLAAYAVLLGAAYVALVAGDGL